ncbi:glycosyltransferase (plasmid) [Cereibacter azotoformans]|uniref:glycosyltransferase n=1 Tax=Cereibacter azotoformans TaxID=43057 RepID=UPI001EEBFBAF|nr:glycosyltransferase [Cereibacter azotoformans]ULB12051.1 glycosyltransferase [Cereibacter azotoformans]
MMGQNMNTTSKDHIAGFDAGNSDPYQRFLKLLGRPERQTGDFRADLLSRRLEHFRVGFQRRNLETAFSANLGRLFPNLIAVDEAGITGDAPVLMYGAILDDPSKSHDSTKKLLPHVRPHDPVLFFEMGFLASTTSWSEALASRDPRQACLSYIFDDRAQYYMSDHETRLDEKLNGDFDLTLGERARAERVMHRIVEARISKYNSQPFCRPSVSPRYSRRVLVVDQNFSDASTFYGRASEQDFQAMLKAAIDENPDAEILVKTHPDLNWVKGGTRHGYFDQMTSEGRVRMVRDSVNPFVLFDLVDKVYVGTSGMGLEALLAGKEVVCFGAPCYAGWGLTDDRVPVPHRRRRRDLTEFFHAFYIWYTIYHLPEGEVPAEIEDVLDYIETHRPVRPTPAAVLAEPAVSIIIPVHDVERYLAECLDSIQRQSLQDYEVILIDDVSTDGSAEIARGYAERDLRFRLVRRETNAGPGFARNQGMDMAQGRHVLFIDPDDYMPDPRHLARIVAMAEEDGADMVRYRKRFEQVEDEQGRVLEMRPDKTEAFFPQEVRRVSVAGYPKIAHSRHFWNWLYRRDFLTRNNVRFLTTYREERAFLLQAYMANPVISVCDSDGVVYRIRSNSAVRRTQTLDDVDDQLLNFDQVITQLEQHGALELASPHWWLARFQVSQFLHYFYFGFAWKTAKAENGQEQFVERLAATMNRTCMGPRDLTSEPSQLSRMHLDAGAYGLLLTATCLRRLDLIETALALKPIKAADLYGDFLREPASTAERHLQEALNVYARNERVTTPASQPTPTTERARLIIHLGATKTGSTVLQHLMEDNRPALLRDGIWYPEVGLFWQQDRPHKQAGHSQFMAEAANGTQKLRQHLLTGLTLMSGRIHTIVLSSEAFFLSPNQSALAEYFGAHFNVEIVIYLRRQDEWANSQYAEFVAGGAINSTSMPLAQWLNMPRTQACLDYDRLIRSWERHLPQRAIHVRRYLRQSGSNWDVIRDFADTTGLKQVARLPLPPRQKTNEARLSAPHVELIRQFNRRPFPSRKVYLRFIEAVESRLTQWRREKALPMPSPWLLTNELADQIMASVTDGNERIARGYFGLTAANLFPPRTVPPLETSLYLAEFEIVESAYAEAVHKTRKRPHPRQLINYGVFSWRLWFSVPLLVQIYRMRGRPDLAIQLKSDPAKFARKHWALRHPKLRWLVYATGSTLGPGRVLRVWLPLLARLAHWRGGEAAVADLKRNPVLFVRNLRNPIIRLIGRLLFPMGEKC